MSDSMISGITVNLFKLIPSKDRIDINYIPSEESSLINDYVHKLDGYGCISGPQYGDYLGLKSGVYFVCNNEVPEAFQYQTLSIDSSSYVMKYIILKYMKRRIEELAREDKVFLPRKWSEYSQITLCDNHVIKQSEPWKLFTIRECLTLRVEHIPLEGRNALFLLADVKIRRFSNLSLAKIIEILLQKGFSLDKMEDSLKHHFYRCVINNHYHDCLLKHLNEKEARVTIDDTEQALPVTKIFLNPHPKFTRDFIEIVLGENLGAIDKIRMALGRQRPKKKIENTVRLINKLLIEKKVFPVILSNVYYHLKTVPQKIVIIGEE